MDPMDERLDGVLDSTHEHTITSRHVKHRASHPLEHCVCALPHPSGPSFFSHLLSRRNSHVSIQAPFPLSFGSIGARKGGEPARRPNQPKVCWERNPVSCLHVRHHDACAVAHASTTRPTRTVRVPKLHVCEKRRGETWKGRRRQERRSCGRKKRKERSRDGRHGRTQSCDQVVEHARVSHER